MVLHMIIIILSNSWQKKFEGQFECFGENTEKYITFLEPIKKELDNRKTITYKLKFIDSLRFMNTSISDLGDSLSEIYKKEWKGWEERRKIKSSCNLIRLKNNKLNYECKECKERCLKPINRLINNFPNIRQFCNSDINKFVLLLRKGVYPYEYMDSWEKCNKTSLPDKRAFYIKLNLEDITDKDYVHAQKVFKQFKLKNIGDYHDFYVQSDALLLADVFGNFRKKCIEIYELDPAYLFLLQD